MKSERGQKRDRQASFCEWKRDILGKKDTEKVREAQMIEGKEESDRNRKNENERKRKIV